MENYHKWIKRFNIHLVILAILIIGRFIFKYPQLHTKPMLVWDAVVLYCIIAIIYCHIKPRSNRMNAIKIFFYMFFVSAIVGVFVLYAAQLTEQLKMIVLSSVLEKLFYFIFGFFSSSSIVYYHLIYKMRKRQ